ncbi:hypothetical protein [Halorientalis salina]|uniref:hypothetical protein n=1 Tax=Halorientalis salina TaxID=2932266 RepID=UPI0010AB7FB6|nr:hypothetical protein [Halorientalis salina]
MGLTESIKEDVFGVEQSNTAALKHGTLMVMNAELLAMFLTSFAFANFLLVGAGFLTGLINRGGPRSALWHGTVAGTIGGYVIATIFAGQYGAFGYRVTPMLSTTTVTDLYWLYDLTALVAFFGIILFVLVDVLAGALIAGLLVDGAGFAEPSSTEA